MRASLNLSRGLCLDRLNSKLATLVDACLLRNIIRLARQFPTDRSSIISSTASRLSRPSPQLEINANAKTNFEYRQGSTIAKPWGDLPHIVCPFQVSFLNIIRY